MENALSAAPVERLVRLPFEPYYDRDGITIYNADCRQVLPFLDRFDLLLTDPPYGLGTKLTGGSGEWSTHFEKSPEWDHAISPDWLVAQAIELCESAVVWGGNYYELPPVRCWLSWDKMQEHTSGHFEMAWTTLDKPTRTFRMSRVEAHSNGKVHPTEKPLRLMKWCLGLVPDAKSVIDPFMGSGTTLVAAKLLGLRAVGIEINRDYCEAAVRRLSQRVLDFGGTDAAASNAG